MNPVRTSHLACAVPLRTAHRVLRQLWHDPASLISTLTVPTILMVLLRFILPSREAFQQTAPALLGLFPLLAVFTVAAVSTLRERTVGVLERLMLVSRRKTDLYFGYAMAFALASLPQIALIIWISVTWLDLRVAGPLWPLALAAVASALFGLGLGLLAGAFARSEFHAMQYVPTLVFPQALLCGLFAHRQSMTQPLRVLSNLMPLSYAVDSLHAAAVGADPDGIYLRNIIVVIGSALITISLGAMALRRAG